MIEDEQYIIETEDTDTMTSVASKFPVKRQLLLIAFILFSIFSSFIVPKIISFLGTGTNQNEVVATAISNSTETEQNSPQKIEGVELKAKAAYVWDVVGQRALFQKNSDERLPLASITKLMTALIAYELVPDSTLVTISDTAAAQQSGKRKNCPRQRSMQIAATRATSVINGSEVAPGERSISNSGSTAGWTIRFARSAPDLLR